MAKIAQFLCEKAASILRQVDNGAGLRQLSYQSEVPKEMQKPFFALVNGVYNEKALLLAVAEESGVRKHLPPDYDETMLLVLLYEVLLGTRRVRGEGPMVEVIKAQKSLLQQTLAKRRKQGLSAPFVEKIHLPRYCRVNRLKTTHKEAENYITGLGLALVKSKSATNALAVEPDSFVWDPLVPDLMALPPRSNLHADPWVESGRLVLQDRSSCLSAWALSPPPGSYVIDGCAAPGNKTVQLASLMEGRGHVFAMERSPDRLTVLQSAIARFGAQNCVSAVGMDFMDIDLEKFKMVTHVLLDPTCSGSGLVAQYSGAKPLTGEGDTAEGKDAKWLAKLSAAQTALVLKAMTLPSVQVLVYSTCSVHKEENEDVVERIVNGQQEFECVTCLPLWPHRGLPGTQFGSRCARASYQSDSTNGFFVARFERKKREGEKVEHEVKEEVKKVKRKKLAKAVEGAKEVEQAAKMTKKKGKMLERKELAKAAEKEVEQAATKTKKKRKGPKRKEAAEAAEEEKAVEPPVKVTKKKGKGPKRKEAAKAAEGEKEVEQPVKVTKKKGKRLKRKELAQAKEEEKEVTQKTEQPVNIGDSNKVLKTKVGKTPPRKKKKRGGSNVENNRDNISGSGESGSIDVSSDSSNVKPVEQDKDKARDREGFGGFSDFLHFCR